MEEELPLADVDKAKGFPVVLGATVVSCEHHATCGGRHGAQAADVWPCGLDKCNMVET